MKYTLQPGESTDLIVHANEHYSTDKLVVQANESYTFRVSKSDKWTDLYIHTTADGFTNPLTWISGIRVKKVKCFCLCACFDEKDNEAFPVGTSCDRVMEKNGELSFFANDAWNFYGNNYGLVKVKITRVS